MAPLYNNLSFDADWGQSILRIWVGGQPKGTAFIIGPRTALTCHHCVNEATASIELRGRTAGGSDWIAPVNETVFPADPATADGALLRFGEDAPHYLPISAARAQTFGDLVAYGYPGSDPRQARVRIDLQLRGLKGFAYYNYSLSEALALAGDPAAPGMSGGPVFDATAGVVVGMIVGGPDFDNRAIALPLWALDTGENPFPAFRLAARSNRRVTVQSGWAMNDQRAKHLCSQQVGDAILKLTRQQRYDPGRSVRRDSFMTAIARFLSSDTSTLVVISGPNSGKTSAMAAAASELTGRSLFLEAYRVDNIRSSLMTYLQRTVDELTQSTAKETVQQIARSLTTPDELLAIFVDGVNEVEDDIAKAEGWIAEAISEAGALSAKLVISCRSDFWSSLDISRESVEVYDLGYFSPAEAESAAGLYGAGINLPPELGRHPLMFKILSDLKSSQDVVARGRFSAIRAFVWRLIKLSPGVRNPDLVFAACERMVRDIAPDEEMVPWDLAANHLGGSGALENLIEGGVFRNRERGTVRFTFDEITEALRPPLPRDLATLVHTWMRALAEPRVATRVVGAMVGAASEGDSELVSTHAEAFFLAFTDFLGPQARQKSLLDIDSFGSVGLIVSILSLDMPAAFSDVTQSVIDRFLSAIVERASLTEGSWFTGQLLAPGIMGLGISTSCKFSVLSDLLALCSDGNLREKDIFDRGAKQELIRDAERSSSIAAALLRLAMDHPREFLHLALPRLDDSRRLRGQGEATVGSVLSSILRINAPVDFDDLFSHLLEASNIDNARRLLSDISSEHPTRALAYSVAALSTSRAIAVMDQAIAPSLRSLGAGLAPLVLLDKLRTVMRESTPETRLKAATLIRIAEPDDFEAWDELANVVLARTGTPQLYPVPAARAKPFINLLRSRSDLFAVQQMRYCYGDDRVESEMVKLAMELLETRPNLLKELAELAEHRLYLAKESSFYSQWVAVGLRVAADPDPEIRKHMIYFAGPRSASTEMKLRIWAQMLSGPVGLKIIEQSFSMVAEESSKQSDTVTLKYLRPMAAEHGRELLKALSGWVSKNASFFDEFDETDADRAALNHVLELLVTALGETDPLLREELGRRLEQSTDWIELFSGADVT